MKKAIEHYEIFKKNEKDSDHFTATKHLILSLLEEVKEIKEKRNSNSDATMISILKEIDMKWRSICGREKTLAKEGFAEFLKSKGIKIT